jgi:hypothetical protein
VKGKVDVLRMTGNAFPPALVGAAVQPVLERLSQVGLISKDHLPGQGGPQDFAPRLQAEHRLDEQHSEEGERDIDEQTLSVDADENEAEHSEEGKRDIDEQIVSVDVDENEAAWELFAEYAEQQEPKKARKGSK